MKDTIKELVRSTIISICMAMTIFCLVGIVFDQVHKGHFSLDNYRFTYKPICDLIYKSEVEGVDQNEVINK